jgi:hypothetical protein
VCVHVKECVYVRKRGSVCAREREKVLCVCESVCVRDRESGVYVKESV